jgi:hypothetical protein
MKKIILSTTLLLCLTIYSQDYNFTYFYEEYQDIQEPIVLNQDSICDYGDTLLELEIGFTFPYYSYSFDRIGIHPHFLFNQFNISSDPDEFISAQLYPFGVAADCRWNNLGEYESQIACKTEGNVGSRICKIQWKNLAFNGSISSDYINYQIWLYENGTIEYRYGGNQLSSEMCFYNEEQSGVTSLTLYNAISQDVVPQSIYLTGNVSNPTVDFGWPETMTGVVDSSMVYRFAPVSLSLKEKNVSLKLSPNPVVDELTINTKMKFNSMTISDLQGRIIYSGEVINKFNFQYYTSGTYFLTFYDHTNLSETHKIVKK